MTYIANKVYNYILKIHIWDFRIIIEIWLQGRHSKQIETGETVAFNEMQ